MYPSIPIKLMLMKLFTFLLTVPAISLLAQTNQMVSEAEEKLKELFDSIAASPDDEERTRSGTTFSASLRETLFLDGSFEHPFSLLPNLSKLTSPDKRLRIYTWNIPLHSGMNIFYGLVQMKSPACDTLTVVTLKDRADRIVSPDEVISDPERWYGAIYYQLITQQTTSGQVFYTLLGWRGENMFVSSRVIDILTVTSSGELLFGKQIFCDYKNSKPVRIIFRHSPNVTMSLRYEEQLVVTNKVWISRRREFRYKREKAWLIVCDRLVPANSQMEGQYEYYIPAGDVMDGFIFRNGCWTFMQQIDARNLRKN